MSAEAAVRAVIVTVATLGNRAYAYEAPAGLERPYCVYSLISTVPQEHLRGDAGLERDRVQVDVYADTGAQADAVARAIRTAMLAATTFSASTLGGFNAKETDTELYRASRDYAVWIET